MLLPTQPTHWSRDAACAQISQEVFYPNEGGNGVEAKQVCAGCPVKSECADYAIEINDRWGVWGGLTYPERVNLRRRRMYAEQAGDAA